MTTESEHPVIHLLSRMLAALNAAEHLTTDAERRRFLNEWLDTACRDSGLHDEIASLRQLLRKNHTMPIGNLLNALRSVPGGPKTVTFSASGQPSVS
ncbi:TPA: hypothetical protein H5X38_004331 [Escherichia coli]|nr:hypothetical protein [Escherichia coli]